MRLKEGESVTKSFLLSNHAQMGLHGSFVSENRKQRKEGLRV
jgi:hypothetical protein